MYKKVALMQQKLKLVKVTTGVYWIEVAEIDVRILCAAPADSIKHLIKKGLVYWTSTNGVNYESGPNMILLSDIMMQHGQFSNLAEFPALQMLYRQGLIIPNHPNNTGNKPILIGDPEQIDIQMEYIYRGNYGLVSEEELLEAGATHDLAQTIMNMKLKFAFGKLSSADNLLDRIDVVGDMVTEIKEGLSIVRTGVNQFIFTYKDEQIDIDLNLTQNDDYEAPYSLGMSNFQREYFSVIHTGEGDGWDTNRPCMGSIITYQGKIYLLDAGPNITQTLDALGIGANELDGVFMTHSHDDHFAGITSLIKSDHKLKFYSSSIVRASVFKKLSILLSMPVSEVYNIFDVHTLEFDKWNDVEGLEVKPILSPHPIETNIYYFRTFTQEGYKSYAHLADVSSFSVLDSMVNDEGGIGITSEFCDMTKNNYLIKSTLKKVDVGGGMIHGEVHDFKDDYSKRLVLSHTSAKLTDEQKQIGSSAAFGTIDVLIESKQDFNYQYAYDYFKAYFPTAPDHALKMMLNYNIITFNPESIIIKEMSKHDNIYIILTGNVDMIQVDFNLSNKLSAGAFIGLISGMLEIESNETYRAQGYVNALEIPAKQFFYFVRQYGLAANIEYTQDRLSFLQNTNLFGEYISFKVLGEVINSMREVEVQGDAQPQTFTTDNLMMLQYGSGTKYCNGDVIGELKEGDYFNYSGIVYGDRDQMEYSFSDDCVVFEIDAEVVKNIPVVYTKLYESYKKDICNFKLRK
jgi:hemerythrin